MQIRLMWWNAGLAPGVESKVSQIKKEAAYSLVMSLIKEYDFDIIGLCEVSLEDVQIFENRLGRLGFGVLAAQEKVGRLKFDMCLIYRLSKLSCFDSEETTLIDSESGSASKVGYGIEVRVADEIIIFILSHWPSRIYKHENHYSRTCLSQSLRKYIKEMQIKGYHNIALMGDYNDEPHSDNMFKVLRAVRDHKLASGIGDLLYNPFWRHLSSDPSFEEGVSAKSISGTHFYSNSNEPQQRWWMFDQMIFSRSFISNGPWYLDEARTGIINISTRVSDWAENPSDISGLDISNSDKRFDHLPIFSTLNRSI